MPKHTEFDLLSLVPIAVLSVSGLVKAHPHGGLLLGQLLVVLSHPGLVAAGVTEGVGELIPGYTTEQELVSRAASWKKAHTWLFSTRKGTCSWILPLQACLSFGMQANSNLGKRDRNSLYMG